MPRWKCRKYCAPNGAIYFTCNGHRADMILCDFLFDNGKHGDNSVRQG